MLEKLREFLRSGAGKALAGAVLLVGLVVAFFTLRGLFVSEGAEVSADRMFVDSETGKPFRYEMSMNEKLPVKSPGGKMSGYPAEACYWTKDGKPKTEPTWVFVKSVWKGTQEPTFCPDCGRLVVGHNPAAGPDKRPPPTKEEYEKNPPRSRERS
jgi:hypothetical protein